ncbi:MAG: hypothetical protein JMJ93_06940 [Synergistaceae bacterium]|nr:hypothetical protein [Synergistaceae bacterium]
MAKALKILFLLLLLLLVLPASPAKAGEGTAVTVEGEHLIYDEAHGRASAEGEVTLSYEDLTMSTPYLELDTERQLVRATSDGTRPVTLYWRGQTFQGESMEYDFVAQRGFVRNASGKVDQLVVAGEDLEVLPLQDALERGIVTAKEVRGLEEGEVVGWWQLVSVTTCQEPHPHYRLTTKKMVVVPGERVIIKQPRVYLGETLIFTYPFDYVVKARESSGVFLPMPRYDGKKGAGLGISGPLTWSTGQAELSVVAWSKIDPEGRLSVTQRLGDHTTFFLESGYIYSDVDDENRWRPRWGFRDERSGWTTELLWSQRESVEIDDVAGVKRYSGTLWREPQLTVEGPWWSDPASGGWWRLLGTWGSYSEEQVEAQRRGGAIDYYGEGAPLGTLQPFWRATYWYYDYDVPDADSQKTTDLAFGFNWSAGSLRLRSTYVRRWVDGTSPMLWDRYNETERVFQRLSVPFGDEWELSLRGGWDLREDYLDEMVYQLRYEVDCLAWELTVRDDRAGDDDWAGLRLIIKAYPDSPLQFREKELEEPGERPGGLPPIP